MTIDQTDIAYRSGETQWGYRPITATRAARLIGSRRYPGLIEYRHLEEVLRDEAYEGPSYPRELGVLIEDLTAQHAARRIGLDVLVLSPRTVIHPDRITLPDGREISWAAASLDAVGVTGESKVIVEVKASGVSVGSDGELCGRGLDYLRGRLPAPVSRQVQWQLWVTGYSRAVVAASVGTTLVTIDVQPDPAFAEHVLAVRELYEAYAIERFRAEEMR